MKGVAKIVPVDVNEKKTPTTDNLVGSLEYSQAGSPDGSTPRVSLDAMD
jgi:hypothetical protein